MALMLDAETQTESMHETCPDEIAVAPRDRRSPRSVVVVRGFCQRFVLRCRILVLAPSRRDCFNTRVQTRVKSVSSVMANPAFQHLPSTGGPPSTRHPCMNCVLGACRQVGGPWVLYTLFASRERKKIIQEYPDLPFRPQTEDPEIWSTNLVSIQSQVYEVYVYEEDHRDTARELLEQQGRRPKLDPDVYKDLSAKEKRQHPCHKTDFCTANAIAASAAIRVALLSGSPAPGSVTRKRVRRKRLTPPFARQVHILHLSVLHVPEDITTGALPVDEANLCETNAVRAHADGSPILMANNSLLPTLSTLSQDVASFPAFQWPVPHAPQTQPMSSSSGYQSSPSSDDTSVLGLPTYFSINHPQLGEPSPFPLTSFSPPSPAFPRWDGCVSSPIVSIPDLSYGIPFPPSAPEDVEAMRREYFGADNSNDLGRFYSTDGYHGPTRAWNRFEA